MVNPQFESQYKARREYDANDNCLYFGEALYPFLGESDEGWRIKKFTWVAGTIDGYITTETNWADGTAAFSKKWSERATYTYS